MSSSSQAYAIHATPIAAAPGVFNITAPPPRIPAVLSLWHAMMLVTSGDSRKRSLATAHQPEKGDDADDHTSSDSDGVKPKKKPSYIARKEDKAMLEKEVKQLEARAEELRKAAGLSTLTTTAQQLRHAVEQQQLMIASAQSVFSDFVTNQQRSPLESFIHLTTDWQQRQAALMTLRGPKIRTARQFLAARTRCVHKTKPSAEISKYQQDDGGFCTIKLSVTPFHGLQSAKRVYDALMFYFFNIEISISEFTGSTTVNENHVDANSSTATTGQPTGPGVLCHRLVTDMGDGIVVEKNSIQFLAHQDPDANESQSPDGEEYTFMASDCVDVDELYPYCPETRLRKDISTALRISSHYEPRSGDEGGEKELVVVLTYWMYVKTHASKLKDRTLSVTELERVHDELVRTMEGLPTCIRQNLYGA